MVEHPGSVIVLPVTAEREVVFVRQYRYTVGETVIELPDQVRVALSADLEASVERLFGPRVRFHALHP